MTGLKRGTVTLVPHQAEWIQSADRTIQILKQLLAPAAIDIQHIGSTAIPSIHAKPIIDLVVGVHSLEDILPYVELLKQHGIVFRGEDVARQLLFVMGDFEKDTRTHHIHVVGWNGDKWNSYINFRDYLNRFPDKAALYDTFKKKLAVQFAADRERYTAGKQELINCLLKEACAWKSRIYLEAVFANSNPANGNFCGGREPYEKEDKGYKDNFYCDCVGTDTAAYRIRQSSNPFEKGGGFAFTAGTAGGS